MDLEQRPGSEDMLEALPDTAGLSVSTRVRAPRPSIIAEAGRAVGQGLRSWWYRSGLYGRMLRGRHPLQLLASPDDPAPGDAAAGQIMLGGEIELPLGTVALSEGFWARLRLLDPMDQTYAHQFHWLQDLAQVSDQTAAVKLAEQLVTDWMPSCETYDALAWAAETLARRQINWITHAPLILSKSDQVYKSRLLTIMAQQARHLMRVVGDTAEGLPRIYGATALSLSGLLLPGGKAIQVKGFKLLTETLADFVLADGGVQSRNPSDAVKVMQQIILVRDAALAVNEDGPEDLQGTLDRLAAFVRALRHTGGAYVQMNGASADYGHGIEAVLSASGSEGSPLPNMPHAGYQRLEAGQTVAIIDAGPPPRHDLSDKAHAGISSFELSSGPARLFVNIGHHPATSPMGELCRTTAAHNALILGERNSTAVRRDGYLGRGVETVKLSRGAAGAGTSVCVTHDGYQKRCNALVSRHLWLSDTGQCLVGEESVAAKDASKLARLGAVVRFHLAPECYGEPAADGSISLSLETGEVWSFRTDGARCALTESLYLPTPLHHQPTQQIVLTFDDALTCRWQVRRLSLS